MFVLTVNPISSWDLSISHCPISSSNSVWSNQTQSGVIKLIFLFPTLFHHPLLLTAIFPSLDPLFCLSSNLKSQSCFVFYLFYSCLQKSFLLSEISPNSLTQYPRSPPSPITQLYFLCSFSLLLLLLSLNVKFKNKIKLKKKKKKAKSYLSLYSHQKNKKTNFQKTCSLQNKSQNIDKKGIVYYILWRKMVLMIKPDNVHMIIHIENVRKLKDIWIQQRLSFGSTMNQLPKKLLL